jgi:hypothetical protein
MVVGGEVGRFLRIPSSFAFALFVFLFLFWFFFTWKGFSQRNEDIFFSSDEASR